MNEHPTSTEMGRGRGTAPFPGAPSPKTNLGRLHKTLDTPQNNSLSKAEAHLLMPWCPVRDFCPFQPHLV